MRVNHRCGTVAAFALALSGIASAIPKVLFSNIASSTTSDVPSFVGVRFPAQTGSVRPFYRPFVSPDGSWWIFKGTAGLLATEDEIIVRGQGLDGLGAATVVQEGRLSLLAGFNWGVMRTGLGIQNNGAYAFASDTTAATGVDDVVVKWNGSGFELIAREGTTGPGMAPTVGYGATNDGVSIGSDGLVSFRSDTLTGATASEALFRNSSPVLGTMLGINTLTIPSGQVAPAQSVATFVANRFVTSNTGLHYMYDATLGGATATNDVIVRDGAVVAQKGLVLPNSGFASLILNFQASEDALNMSPDGNHYMFRGTNADNLDWVYSDGAVIAKRGSPIVVGSSETWSDSRYANGFIGNLINNNGDTLIAGYTSNATITRDSVLVLNNRIIVAREGDPVDVNGNGLADDNAFISVFGSGGSPVRDDDMAVTSDHKVYFVAQLKNAANAAIGLAMIVVVADPVPLSFEVIEGTLFDGTVYDLQASDDRYVGVFNDDTTLGAGVEFAMQQAYTTASQIDVTFESSVGRGGLAQSFRMFNYTSNQWVPIAGGTATTSDSDLEAQLTSSAHFFVDGTGNMRAQILWTPVNDEDPSQDGWLHFIDLVRCVVTP